MLDSDDRRQSGKPPHGGQISLRSFIGMILPSLEPKFPRLPRGPDESINKAFYGFRAK